MAGCFPAAPVINDWQGFDQGLSEIESPWGGGGESSEWGYKFRRNLELA